ncbi:MAG: hypothetical protein ACAI25_00730 [Planctomycetota bacterium]
MLRRIGVGLLALVVAATFSVVNSGCGTVMGHAQPQPITINLNPDVSPVEVFVDGVKMGDKAGTFEVDPKRESHQFRITTQDGRQGNGTVTRELMPGVVIADAVMLLFPILIDYFNGGLYKWQSTLTINLGKAPESQGMPTDTGRPSNATTNTSNTNTAPTMVTCATCGEKRPANNEACPHCGVK